MIFQFLDYSFDASTFELIMRYSYSNLDHVFIERLDFANFKNTQVNLSSLQPAFKILFLVSGISYYKIFASGQIDLAKTMIDRQEAEFLNFFYKNGLSEFICRNNLSFSKNIPDFTKVCQLENSKAPASFELSPNALLAWGGGKDSIVSSLILDKLKLDYDLFAVKSDRIKEATAQINGHKFYEVKRFLDPGLSQINKLPDALNGHVPITGILAFIKTVVALMANYSNIILSNEFSADEGNLVYEGQKINHQFSKGLEFEMQINNYIQSYIHVNLCYFSLLRPFYEIKIAEIFAKFAQNYFADFSSCNRNFHFDKSKNLSIEKNFCGNCEKCAFVFLILAPFVKKADLLNIFSSNLFENPNLRIIFQELLGLSNKKPFECVGTFTESQKAIDLLNQNLEWKDDKFVKEMYNQIQDLEISDNLFELQDTYLYPSQLYLRIKNEFA